MKILNEVLRTADHPQTDIGIKWSIWNDVINISDTKCVIFNTVTRNAVLMNCCNFHSKVEDIHLSDRDVLYQLGILVDASRDEASEQQIRFHKGKEDFSYIDLTILVTHSCQMRCTYCFEGGKENTFISERTMEDIIRLLGRFTGVCKKLRVTWFGGEPLLAYRQMRQMSVMIIQFCKENQIEYSADITTNGYALSLNRCKELVDDLKVKRFIITIDGPASIHDKRRPLASGETSFQRIWSNICTLVDCGGWVTLRMTIDRENRPYISEFLNLLANSKLKGRVGISFCRTIGINFTPDSVSPLLYNDEEWASEEWQLIQMAHKLGLWSYGFPHAAPTGGCLRQGDITISASGLIYKCLDTIGDQRWTCGNLARDTKVDVPIWYQKWMEWSPMDNETCCNCVLQPLCNGGCPHNALYPDKRHGTNLQCPDWKANYKKQIIEIATQNIK